MSLLATSLVLLSALFHALWNFAAKKAQGGAIFVWVFGVIEFIVYLPLTVYVIFFNQPEINFLSLVFIIGSAILHLLYFLLLSKGYQVGDLSIVYPLARAIGPLIATTLAIILFAERPSILAAVGSLLICGGAFLLTGNPSKLKERGALQGVRFACFTGCAIAAYTLWDAYAVSQLLIAPIIFQWGIGATRVVILTPYALSHWDKVELAWEQDKWKAAFVAVFSPLAYLLILLTLSFSPVSYVAPMRVISTLIGVVMGASLLKEGDVVRRLSAATVMVLGIIALSIG